MHRPPTRSLSHPFFISLSRAHRKRATNEGSFAIHHLSTREPGEREQTLNYLSRITNSLRLFLEQTHIHSHTNKAWERGIQVTSNHHWCFFLSLSPILSIDFSTRFFVARLKHRSCRPDNWTNTLFPLFCYSCWSRLLLLLRHTSQCQNRRRATKKYHFCKRSWRQNSGSL